MNLLKKLLDAIVITLFGHLKSHLQLTRKAFAVGGVLGLIVGALLGTGVTLLLT